MSYLFWYKVLFITELIVAEGMLAYAVPRRPKFALRLIGALLICYAAAFLYPLFGINYTWYGSSVMFFVLFCVTVAGLWFCFRVRFSNVLFCAVTAYAVQHIAYEIFSFINILLFDSDVFTDVAYGSDTFLPSAIAGVGPVEYIIYLFVYTCIYLVSYTVLHRRTALGMTLRFNNLSIIGFTSLVLLTDIVLSAVSQYALPASDRSWQLLVCIYNILCCIIIFYIHMSMVKKQNAEYEKEVISELFRQYQKNYRVQEESIQLINRKCHDFKHRIRMFASGQGIADKEAVEELSDLISIYDTSIRTGNDALDIILTEKSLLCREKGITLTCLADGKSISFMKSGEVYALFGNILDNAIEAVMNVDDRDKRCINLHVTRKSGIIAISSDNYFQGELAFTADGLPKTTKAADGNHGFGMKSIRALAESYGGMLYVTADDHIFRMSIVIPDNFS